FHQLMKNLARHVAQK
ncbi:hypothetical protein D030_3886B, partial [Vibrio parahaemolyticus AQ3810]